MVFGTKFNAPKLKTSLRLAMSRIKLLQNKRDNQLKVLRREIAQLLSSGQETSAAIRVEHVMREQNIITAYEFIELYSELVVVRLPIIEKQSECPLDLREAISSLIYAAPRCADVEELGQIRAILAAKYGKDFVAAAAELRPDCGVSRNVIEKLSARAPSGKAKLGVLKAIAKEHNVDWDSTVLENTLAKPPEDLLDGSRQFTSANDVPSLRRHSEDLPSLQPMQTIGKGSSTNIQSPSSTNRPSSTVAQAASEVQKPYIHQPKIPPPSSTVAPSRQQSETIFASQAITRPSQNQKPAGGDDARPHDSYSGPSSMGSNDNGGGNQAVQPSRRQEFRERTQINFPQDNNPRSGKEGNSTRQASTAMPQLGEHSSRPAEGMDFKDVKEVAVAASASADRAVAAAQAAAQLATNKYQSSKSTAADENFSKVVQRLSHKAVGDDDDIVDEDDTIENKPNSSSDEDVSKISNQKSREQMDGKQQVNQVRDPNSDVHPIYDEEEEEDKEDSVLPRKPVIQGSFDGKMWLRNDDDEEYLRRQLHSLSGSANIFSEERNAGKEPAKRIVEGNDTWKSESHPSYDSSGSDDDGDHTHGALHWPAAAGKTIPKSLRGPSVYEREPDDDRDDGLKDPDGYIPEIRNGTAGMRVGGTRNTIVERLSDDNFKTRSSSSHWSHGVDEYNNNPLSPPEEDSHHRRRIINTPPFEDGEKKNKPLFNLASVAPAASLDEELNDNRSSSYRGDRVPSDKTPRGLVIPPTGKLKWQSRDNNKQESETRVHDGDIEEKPAVVPDGGDTTQLDGYPSSDDEYYIPKAKMTSAALLRTKPGHANDAHSLKKLQRPLNENDSPQSRKHLDSQSLTGQLQLPLKVEESKRVTQVSGKSSEVVEQRQNVSLRQPSSISSGLLLNSSPPISRKTSSGISPVVSGKSLKFVSRSGYHENPSTSKSIEAGEIAASKLDDDDPPSRLSSPGSSSVYNPGSKSGKSFKAPTDGSIKTASLVDSKASSKSWGQQKVPSAKEHQKTQSIPTEQAPSPQKFKLIRPPDIDDIEAMLGRKL